MPCRLPFSALAARRADRKSTRLNSSHVAISYAVFCLKKKKTSRTPSDRGATAETDHHNALSLHFSFVRIAPTLPRFSFVFFFNDTATTEIYTLSLHDALPICGKAS